LQKPVTGSATSLVDGQSQNPVITKSEFDTKIELGNQLAVSMSMVTPSGDPIALSPEGIMQVDRNSTLSASGFGFKANSPVEVWLNSEPKYLGTGESKADGTFANTFALDPSIATGEHTVVLHGVTPADEIITMALGVSVIDAQQSVDESESSFSVLQLALMVFLIAIVLIWILSRRNKRD
jgi:hypothetical protein